jgi:hypothetical protein
MDFGRMEKTENMSGHFRSEPEKFRPRILERPVSGQMMERGFPLPSSVRRAAVCLFFLEARQNAPSVLSGGIRRKDRPENVIACNPSVIHSPRIFRTASSSGKRSIALVSSNERPVTANRFP